MTHEIDADFYCGAYVSPKYCRSHDCTSITCEAYRRKWPTPEQFKEEFGREYPNAGLVFFKSATWDVWLFDELDFASKIKERDARVHIVCACSPFGKPPSDWRPEGVKEI